MKKIILACFGLILFILIIFYLINPQQLWLILKRVNYFYLILVFILSFFLLGFKVKRWQSLMKKQEIKYSFNNSFGMYSVAVFFSLITPGKIGEIIKIFYLHRDKQPLGKALITVVGDRLFDFAFLIFLFLIGFGIFLRYFQQQMLYLIIILVVFILFIYLIFKTKSYLKLLKFFIPVKYRDIIFAELPIFLNNLKKYKIKDYLSGFILTSMASLVYIIQVYLLSLSLGLKLNFLFLIPMIAIANAADLLPISFNGLGTREAIFIFFFGLINLSAEKAVALSILQLFIVFSTALIGFFCWLKMPISLRIK